MKKKRKKKKKEKKKKREEITTIGITWACMRHRGAGNV